jgi:hypothetical protein
LKASLTDEMVAAMICREMKWTLEEYESQPTTFIDTIIEMLKAESAEIKKKNKSSWQSQ